MTAEQISTVLAAAGLCLGILICFILLLANKTHVHANRLLALMVFSLTLAMLQAYLIYTGQLVNTPHLFRVSSPFFYISLPAGYLYVRSVVNDETGFRKYDMIHFLPALIHVVELTPFYLKSTSQKRAIVEHLLQNPGQIAQLNEGLLPPYMHNLFRSILGILYIFLLVRLLTRAAREGKKELLQSATFTWLKWFTGLMALAIFSVLFILLIPGSVLMNKTLGLHLSIISCFVTLNFFLFFKPQILYGIPKLRMQNVKLDFEHSDISAPAVLHGRAFQSMEEAKHLQEKPTSANSLDYLLAYKPILELHLEKNKPYLQQGYNVAKLSLETGIPQHHLSALLNKVYGVRFNDFINQYRINHITSHFDQLDWGQKTLEGIASEAGFNSRTTFFNAIKKSSGLSPSEYINKIRKGRQTTDDRPQTTGH